MLALFPLLVSLLRCHMSTLFPASVSTFRLSVSRFQFRPCLRIALAKRFHHLSLPVFLVLYPDSSLGYSTVAPPVKLSGVSHTPSVPSVWCCLCHCLGVVFLCVLRLVLAASVPRCKARPRALCSPPMSHITVPVLPLHVSVLVSFL